MSGGPFLTSPAGRRAAAAVVAAAIAVVAAGCTAGPTAGQAPVPDPVPTVEVRLADEDLTVERPVPAGHVVFHVRNTGSRDHRVVLFPMGADWPPIHQEIANDTQHPVRFRARVPNLAPGETGRFAVDLATGQRYGLLDYSTGPEGQPHLTQGVAGEFTPQPTDSRASPPAFTPQPSATPSANAR